MVFTKSPESVKKRQRYAPSKDSCTACGEHLNTLKKSKVSRHRLLNVLVCNRCRAYYGDGNFAKFKNGVDADGDDNYCRWCADGGDILVCDCHKGFCTECVNRNFGAEGLESIQKSNDWSCFSCDPSQMQSLIDHCEKVLGPKKADGSEEEECPQEITPLSSDEEGSETDAKPKAGAQKKPGRPRKSAPGRFNIDYYSDADDDDEDADSTKDLNTRTKRSKTSPKREARKSAPAAAGGDRKRAYSDSVSPESPKRLKAESPSLRKRKRIVTKSIRESSRTNNSLNKSYAEVSDIESSDSDLRKDYLRTEDRGQGEKRTNGHQTASTSSASIEKQANLSTKKATVKHDDDKDDEGDNTTIDGSDEDVVVSKKPEVAASSRKKVLHLPRMSSTPLKTSEPQSKVKLKSEQAELSLDMWPNVTSFQDVTKNYVAVLKKIHEKKFTRARARQYALELKECTTCVQMEMMEAYHFFCKAMIE